MAYDSITYINIYVLNDSVIQVNDSLFELENWIEDKTTKYPDYSRYKKDTDSLGKYIMSIENDSSVFNVFLDTSCHFGILDNLFYSFINSQRDEKKNINILDVNNNYIPVLNLKYNGSCTPMEINISNFLEILINKENELLIESEWDMTYEDILTRVKEWYTNPMNKDHLPRMDVYTENEIRKNIAILKANISSFPNSNSKGKTRTQKVLNNWIKKLETQQQIGDYKTINSASTIFIQTDNRNEIIEYLTVLDKINQGLLELRNELCFEKFKLKYNNLHLSLSKEIKMKHAIDQVFPVKIIPTIYIYNLAPPPPSVN